MVVSFSVGYSKEERNLVFAGGRAIAESKGVE
jgi:hypothetical protein